ncbi:MAG: ATP-binding protein, partial [Mobilitalea sp.]
MKRFIIMIMLLLLSFNTTAIAANSIPIEFTEEEQTFINEHPTIRLGVDPEFIPYEFIDNDGQYKGIAADYIQLLSQEIGIQMIVEPDLIWSEAYELAVEKELDVLPCISKTTERQQYFLFSDPYFTFQRVIIVRDDNESIKSLEDLRFTTVSVQQNSSHHSYLKNIPEINLSLYSSVEKALVAVSKGYENTFVGNLATSAYLIKSYGLTGLKYVSLDSADQQYLHFAVRNDWPLLVDIINKGLSNITEEEKMVIQDKWIGLESPIDYGRIIRTVAVAAGIIITILIVSIYWILRLKKEISKRKLIEEELMCAKTEAEIANRIKSTFLARMSHEIRTPLNAITGMAYLIKKSDVTLSQRMYVDKITQAAHNMLSIINDILDFSKIESGKVEIESISFSLDKVIQQVISIISFKIEEQGVGFALNKGPQIPVYFIGDPKRIEQILLNLLSNAIKFTNDGEVSLNIRLVAQEGERYHLEFAVKDTGIGMSEDQVAQLFVPFTQADSSINRRFGGTGLGLSIVKSLVEMMNGEIYIYSSEGKGSTFVIQLPLQIDATKDFEEKEKAASLYLQNIRALVLVKNDSLINLIESYLDNFGIHADFTKSPSNAQQLLTADQLTEKSPYDLLLMDYDVLVEKSFEYTKTILDDPEILIKPKFIML